MKSDEEIGRYDMAGGEGEGEGEANEPDDYAPEVEDAYTALLPATTDEHVFIANPDRGTVTRVTAADLSVITTDVGVDPYVVRATSDNAAAVVFNRGTDDVSIVDATTLEVDRVEVRPDFNQLLLSADGVWAVAFHDADRRTSDDLSDDTWSFNEVSLVDVPARRHIPMVVGFNPRDLKFTQDSRRMVVVSDAYLAVVDLSEDSPEPVRIPIAEDTVEPPVAEEVILTPDGSYAIVRQLGGESLVVVDLKNHTVDRIDVGETPTDLDVTPDGESAVAVARGSHELWVYDLNDIYATPEVISMPEGEVLGSIVMSPDDSQALLFSTATGVSRYVSWDRSTDEMDVHATVKPISGINVSPDGATAVLVHDRDNGDTDSDSVFYNEYAVTLVDLSDYFANPIRLPAEPTEFAQTNDGDIGFVIMEAEDSILQLNYRTLIHDEVLLKSTAVHMGVMPDSRLVYASQEHDLGRISFYDPDEGELQTITGFELNAGIEIN
jgi:DNA-binding beta-propeller fold protein YncE